MQDPYDIARDALKAARARLEEAKAEGEDQDVIELLEEKVAKKKAAMKDALGSSSRHIAVPKPEPDHDA